MVPTTTTTTTITTLEVAIAGKLLGAVAMEWVFPVLLGSVLVTERGCLCCFLFLLCVFSLSTEMMFKRPILCWAAIPPKAPMELAQQNFWNSNFQPGAGVSGWFWYCSCCCVASAACFVSGNKPDPASLFDFIEAGIMAKQNKTNKFWCCMWTAIKRPCCNWPNWSNYIERCRKTLSMVFEPDVGRLTFFTWTKFVKLMRTIVWKIIWSNH